MAKVQISIDDELLNKVDKFAETMYMSRSGFISYSCAQIINTNAAMVAITDVSLALKKIAESGQMTLEDKQRLDDFERVVKLITSSK